MNADPTERTEEVLKFSINRASFTGTQRTYSPVGNAFSSGLLHWQLLWCPDLPNELILCLVDPVDRVIVRIHVDGVFFMAHLISHEKRFFKFSVVPKTTTSARDTKKTSLVITDYIKQNDLPDLQCTLKASYKRIDWVNIKGLKLYQKFTDSDLADILVLHSGGSLPAHSGVLCSRVPSLTSVVRKSNGTLDIWRDVGNPIVDALLCFVYSDVCPIVDYRNGGEELFHIAIKYKINKLVRQCEFGLASCLDSINCIRLLFVAEKHSAQYLKAKASEYASCHPECLKVNVELEKLLKSGMSFFRKCNFETSDPDSLRNKIYMKAAELILETSNLNVSETWSLNQFLEFRRIVDAATTAFTKPRHLHSVIYSLMKSSLAISQNILWQVCNDWQIIPKDACTLSPVSVKFTKYGLYPFINTVKTSVRAISQNILSNVSSQNFDNVDAVRPLLDWSVERKYIDDVPQTTHTLLTKATRVLVKISSERSSYSAIQWMWMYTEQQATFYGNHKYVFEYDPATVEEINSEFAVSLYRSMTAPASSNCQLVVPGSTFHAHRDVLSAQSPVFRAMFYHDCLETHSGVVYIGDFEPSSVDCFLQYIYTGTLTLIYEDKQKLQNKQLFLSLTECLVLADKYEVLRMKSRIEQIFTKSISFNMAITFLCAAERGNSTVLQNAVIEYLAWRPQRCMELPEWSNMEDDYPDFAVRMLKLFLEQAPKDNANWKLDHQTGCYLTKGLYPLLLELLTGTDYEVLCPTAGNGQERICAAGECNSTVSVDEYSAWRPDTIMKLPFWKVLENNDPSLAIKALKLFLKAQSTRCCNTVDPEWGEDMDRLFM